jgi:PKHD-type hydroxylase
VNESAAKRLVYALPDRIERDEQGQAALRWSLPGAPFEADASWNENPAVSTVRVLPGAFSADACRRMLALGDAVGREQGEVEKGDRALRRSELSWIPPSETSVAFYHRVGMLFHQANLEYRFVLRGLAEPLQIARYGIGGHFDWHTDSGLRETAGRKLSLTVQLSDDADYEGGNLEFINIHGKRPARGLGTAIIFPSFLAHRVAPVTRGERVSIVAWAYGPSFV